MNPNLWVDALSSELDWGFAAKPNPHLYGHAFPYSIGRVERRTVL